MLIQWIPTSRYPWMWGGRPPLWSSPTTTFMPMGTGYEYTNNCLMSLALRWSPEMNNGSVCLATSRREHKQVLTPGQPMGTYMWLASIKSASVYTYRKKAKYKRKLTWGWQSLIGQWQNNSAGLLSYPKSSQALPRYHTKISTWGVQNTQCSCVFCMSVSKRAVNVCLLPVLR